MIRYFGVKTTATVVVVSALLTSCVTAFSPETAKRLSNSDLCMEYGYSMRSGNPQSAAHVAAEYTSRGGTPPGANELALIQRRSVVVGMSECSMLAAMGSPDTQNNTTTATGRATQYVFRPYAGSKVIYVYTERGRVTAVQD